MSAGWISDHMVGIPPTSIETSQDGWNSNHLQLLNWPFLFIGPESDHWLCLSVTNSLTDCRLENLIDVSLVCEDGNSNLVEVVDDEKQFTP